MPPRKTTCLGLIIQGTKWLPVLVTALVYSWGWYAFTFKVAIESVESLVEKVIYLVIFHTLYILSLWSYIQTIFAPIGRVPSKFFVPPEMTEDLARATSDQQRDDILSFVAKRNDLPVACRTYLGGIRYCEKCNMIKPDRCHHCSVCGICVLRMDHHCPWINNCVSFTNYKFFVLFLGYTCALCLFACATTFPYFIKFWSVPVQNYNPASQQNNLVSSNVNSNQSSSMDSQVPFSVKFHVLFLFCLSGMLCLGVMFLLFYHIHLLLHNRSTLEAFRAPLMVYGPDSNAFNLGKRENFLQLFGRSKLLWFVPLFSTEGSGLTYDQRPQLGPGDEEARQELLNHRNNSNVNTNVRNGNDTEL